MGVEAGAALVTAWRAHSPALVAFGAESAVELLSAAVVLSGFRANARQEHAELRATRIAGLLLYAVAAGVVAASLVTFLGYSPPKPTLLGIAILLAAAVFMPLLAREKRRLFAVTASSALRADAVGSAVCGYLSMIALVGLIVNAVWHVGWADSVAALMIVPLVVWEGRETIRGMPRGFC
jgi:divalent metal cation (Fe/Co/Zn/Cd) transporter